ncbi:hypothetical protein P691DRAFT_769959 [Macrolepiota fuliginosa MF-IS2]|uniref:Uncharacterized protein n=1 Tax=Macrolepiota fuliginosa MF-IS2 TaxID=1400762 RepID=A0A9P6BUN1_9AGAR|nr:hypothetical protein P691DRAFT_769959 [Macrolepiota fuliginosa MF-IS2]
MLHQTHDTMFLVISFSVCIFVLQILVIFQTLPYDYLSSTPMSPPLFSVHPPWLHLVYPFINGQFCPGHKLRPSQYQEGHNSQVEAKVSIQLSSNIRL